MATKRLLYIFYQKALPHKSLRKETKNPRFIMKGQQEVALLAKPFYKIDVLLYFLNFFSSVYQVKQFLARGKLLLNSNCIKTPGFLQKGNLLSIKSSTGTNRLFVTLLRKQKSPKKKFLSFLEVDYYTKSIIVVQTLSTLSNHDLALVLETKIRAKSFKKVF